MTQQQWQPVPGPRASNHGSNWSAPDQGRNWAPPAHGQWGPPAGQPWQGQSYPGPRPGQQPYPGPRPGQGPWGPPQPPGQQPGQFTRPGPHAPRPNGSAKKKSPLRYIFGLAAAVIMLVLAGVVFSSFITDDNDDVAYANEDYAVPAVDSAPPALPSPPKTFDEAYPIVEENPLYSQTVANPVRCDIADIDAGARSTQLESELNDYMECQLRVWGPTISAAGFTPVRPSVTVYRDQVVSACGTMKGEKAVNAFYCGADQRVFYSTLLGDALPIARRPHVIELILAHEFGHAVQARTGIIVTGHLLASNADTEDESLEIQRRIETQADCLSGMFMRSVADSKGLTQGDLATLEQAWRQFGDDTSSRSPTPGDHGTGASRQLWGNRGLDSGDVGQCNTFTAPAAEVR